jgi:hypothetical protein
MSIVWILSILSIISVVTVTTISCADRRGPGPDKIDAGPGEINAGPGKIDAGPGESALEKINGSGNIIKSEIDVNDFNIVEVSGEGILIIEQGDAEGLIIKTDDNLLEYVKVSISEKKLEIENMVDDGYDLVPTEAIYYYLNIKDIIELKLPGVVTVECDSLRTSSLNLDMSGVVDVGLSGEIGILNISVDGVGTLNGRDFSSTECSISGTGNANIIISVSEILDIDFKGIGSIKYIGDPEVKKDVGKLVDVENID